MIFFLDTQERVVGHASNDAPQALPYKNDKLSEDLDTGAQTFEFMVPANHAESGRIREEGYIVTQGYEGELLQFQIAELEDVHDGDGLFKRIYCEFAWSELNGHIVRPYDLPSADAETAAAFALSGTRWQVGKIDFAGVQDLSSDNYDTALKMLQDIKEAFGGDIRFYVTMSGTKITGRFVDLVQRVGANRGKTVTFDKNIQSAHRIFSRTSVATALIGLGRGDSDSNRLTFTNTVWTEGVNGAPVTKPAGQDWVGDPDALKLWGVDGRHITKVFEYDTTNPTVLLKKTWEELQRIKAGVYQYEVEAAFLDALGWDWERSAVGDTVQIYDHIFEPPLMLEARIVQLERSKTDPNANKMVLGDYLPRMSRAQDMMEIQSTLMKNYEKWGSGGMKVVRQAEEPAGDPNTIWVRPFPKFDLAYTWDTTQAKWVPSGPLYAADIDAQDSIFLQSTPPPHLAGRLWMDTTTSPNILKRSTGSAWVNASPTTAAHVGAESALYKQASAPAHSLNRLWLETDVTPNVLWRSTGTAWVKVTPTLAAEVQADAAGAAAAAQAAAESVARAEASAAQTAAESYADGQVTAEESARIAQANTNLAAAKEDAQLKANAARDAAISAAAIDAAQKASAAQTAAEGVARAEAAAAQARAEATADGYVTAEENARIAQANSNLETAKADATSKANAAQSAAEELARQEAAAAQAASDPKGSAATAEQNAKNYAEPQVIKQTTAPAHLNGRLWLDTSVTPNILKRSTGTAWVNASPTTAGQVGAEGTVYKQATAPAHLNGRLWLDTSVTPNVLKRSTGTAWVNATPTTAGEVGAETPAAAQNKAKVAEYLAYRAAVVDQSNQITQQAFPIVSAPAGQYTDAVKTAAKLYRDNMINTSKPALLSAIDTAIADGVVTATEESNISSKKQAYENDYLDLSAQITKATQDASGLTVGKINITDTATIGNALYLGTQSSVEYKYIYFNSSNRIYSDGNDTFIYSDGDINLNSYGVDLYSNGGSFYMQGSFLSVEFSSVAFSAAPEFSSGLTAYGSSYFYGATYFYSTTGTNLLYWNGVNFVTNVPETGFCGVGGYNAHSTNSGTLAGVGVNFRVKKTYTPSSISIFGTSSNIANSSQVACIDISPDGFWLYINAGTSALMYRYWRGKYTA